MDLNAAVTQACEWLRYQRQDKDGETVARELEQALAESQAPPPPPEPTPAPEPTPE